MIQAPPAPGLRIMTPLILHGFVQSLPAMACINLAGANESLGVMWDPCRGDQRGHVHTQIMLDIPQILDLSPGI